MNGSDALSQVGGIHDKLKHEIDVRNKVEEGMVRIQTEIDQLKHSSVTTSTTPVLSSTSMNNAELSSQSPPNPVMYPAPQMVFPVPRFQPPAFQQPMQQMNTLAQINCLNAHLQSLKQELFVSNNNINDLYEQIGRIRDELNEQKQYDQRNNLIVHGWDDVPISPRKPTQEHSEIFTNYVVAKLNFLFPDIKGGISDRDIDDAHIYRTKSSNRSSSKQLVIIRFCSRLIRNKIFSMKKCLKGTGFSITEHLTQSNLKLLKAAQKRLGNVKYAWTHYGKIIINLDGVIKSVHNFNELDYLTG